MDFELLKQLLVIAISASVISTAFMQKIKESCLLSSTLQTCYLIMISFGVSMIVGTLFALTFANTTFGEALWVGLFTFVGADSIYKMLEDKVFASFKNLQLNKHK